MPEHVLTAPPARPAPAGSLLASHECGDITVRYPRDPKTGRVGLEIIPTTLVHRIQPRRRHLSLPHLEMMNCVQPAAFELDSLVQVKLLGDAYAGGFAQGHTMRNSPSVDAFAYDDQRVDHSGGETVITTTLKSDSGCVLDHRVAWREGNQCLRLSTTFRNESDRPVQLEMLSSFSLGGITPFDGADAAEKLLVHRFRSGWSAEGRLETRPMEQLGLERSWSGHAMLSERFGQVGSMPVRKWFPFVALEDKSAGVVWGAQLAWGGSWQMEIFRQHDGLCLSGGLADREFGHWMKTVAPGESFTTPTAIVSCAAGTLDDLCDRLTAQQQRAADLQPAVEQDLPIIFNEWCTTFGQPEQGHITAIADRLRETACRYLVIDAGWYRQADADWSDGHGDWIPSRKLFPDGLKAMSAAIRERGLIPGLWFEMETVGTRSTAFSQVEHLLQRDGVPITSGNRRFWDMNDPVAVDFLTERVIGLLEKCGFGYLKVDYNETIGIGCDHPDSLGEGLRNQIEGVHRFFERIRERMPGLVIENCASGGHRLEPSFLARTAMSSFSDAHEVVEIPIIAAGLHRLMLPRQSQIWAVLRRSDSRQRLAYSLAATFLGRMCLSGDVTELAQEQWELVLQAQELYRKAAPVIKEGTSRHYGELGVSWRHPKGWQAVVRTSGDGRSALVVAHGFAGAPGKVEVPVGEGKWLINAAFPGEIRILAKNRLSIAFESDFSAQVVLLEKAG